MSQIELRSVSFSYGRSTVIDRLNLRIGEGEHLLIQGPSGMGKSTLLRLICGLLRPVEGEILVEGVVVASRKVFVPAEKRRIGMVFQDLALFPHLTAAENISFGIRNEGEPERRKIVKEFLERYGLSGLGPRFPHELSGGQQQRVALARSLAPNPKALLLDEPFSSLDPDLRVKVRRETFETLHRSKITCVLVTHDPSDVSDWPGNILKLG